MKKWIDEKTGTKGKKLSVGYGVVWRTWISSGWTKRPVPPPGE